MVGKQVYQNQRLSTLLLSEFLRRDILLVSGCRSLRENPLHFNRSRLRSAQSARAWLILRPLNYSSPLPSQTANGDQLASEKEDGGDDTDASRQRMTEVVAERRAEGWCAISHRDPFFTSTIRRRAPQDGILAEFGDEITVSQRWTVRNIDAIAATFTRLLFRVIRVAQFVTVSQFAYDLIDLRLILVQ
jgi:hypothetical protein